MEYAQARYYNPAHGRFTSVDPLTASATIKNPQTFNRYSYVLNSPYKFTDPLGLLPEKFNDDKIKEDNPEDRVVSKTELDLILWHIANGTVLGYAYLNAMQGRQIQVPPPDNRPNIADMVENNNGVDQDKYKVPGGNWENEEGVFRFGEGHDGEHVWGDKNGSNVNAIEGLTGIV